MTEPTTEDIHCEAVLVFDSKTAEERASLDDDWWQGFTDGFQAALGKAGRSPSGMSDAEECPTGGTQDGACVETAEERAINDKIDAWHAGADGRPLHEALGMTWEQYKVWVQGRTLPA